jgi:hypothetical protein
VPMNRAAAADGHARLPVLGLDFNSVGNGSELTTADSGL